MCWKDPGVAIPFSTTSGSPPHVRERLKASGSEDFLVGITPACAGKTSYSREHFIHVWDHPRMCGKDSNGSLYFRPFTPADIQNLFNFFAKHLTSSASPNAR